MAALYEEEIPAGESTSGVLSTLVLEPTAAAAKIKKGCPTVLNKNGGACPPAGCAGAGAVPPDPNKAAQNKGKKHLPDTSSTPVRLSFADMEDLQKAVAELLPPGEHMEVLPKDRKRLAQLQVPSGVIGEGDYVELRGYLSGDGKRRPGPAGDESVNCDGEDGVDYHIPVTEEPGVDEHYAIVTEMIPQARSDDWTPAKLRKILGAKHPVRVRGQLFFDNEHKVNSNPHHDEHGQPKRFSLWEIHPITSFEVCPRSTCTPESTTGWVALEEWE
jgi:hypothetical protein